jgi:hypothetical protein
MQAAESGRAQARNGAQVPRKTAFTAIPKSVQNMQKARFTATVRAPQA